VDPRAGTYKLSIGTLYYIGSSTNIPGRQRTHIKALTNGTHRNHKLQTAYNNNPNPTWETTPCHWNQTRINEQTLLDTHHDDPNCLNIEREAISTKHPTRKLTCPPWARSHKPKRPPSPKSIP